MPTLQSLALVFLGALFVLSIVLTAWLWIRRLRRGRSGQGPWLETVLLYAIPPLVAWTLLALTAGALK